MKVGVVIVTFNRLEKLKLALESFKSQTYLPSYVLVVNNASTDGTESYLDSWKIINEGYEKRIISMKSNTGGSGGFYAGLEAAQNMDSDWIWLSDDDAFPEKTALEYAVEYLESKKNALSDISAICASVINMGKIDLAHRSTFYTKGLKILQQFAPEKFYTQEDFEINTFSYVGAIVNRNKLLEVGLTQKNYFIWSDDSEHSLRLSKVGKILVVPKIRVIHDVVYDNNQISWKEYYGIRNNMDMFKRHMPKYCFYYRYFSNLIRLTIKRIIKKDIVRTEMHLSGLKDFRNQHFGIHNVYKPGWKA